MRVFTKVVSIALLSAAAIAGAQTVPPVPHAYVRVSARDSLGTPIPGAELTVVRGLRDVIAAGTTDDAGLGLLAFDAKDSVDLQVTMRKIGYARTDHFFAAGPRDTAIVKLVAARPQGPQGQALDGVKITAKRDVKSASYDLNADDIANANVPLLDGWDVVKKLRPDMLTSRGGCATGIRDVWVNGKRIVLPLPPTGITAERARVGVPPRARFSYIPVSVLSDIAPEHIQELIYHDCFDATMAKVGTTDALFVVLKPGIVYERGVGSFVDDVSGRP
ncbi:MAG: hypothetical protein JWM41_3359 [Gemmatimonadetes bacterium]|nr:hypothetical protein [Gemmatimonadota bacterium]